MPFDASLYVATGRGTVDVQRVCLWRSKSGGVVARDGNTGERAGVGGRMEHGEESPIIETLEFESIPLVGGP